MKKVILLFLTSLYVTSAVSAQRFGRALRHLRSPLSTTVIPKRGLATLRRATSYPQSLSSPDALGLTSAWRRRPWFPNVIQKRWYTKSESRLEPFSNSLRDTGFFDKIQKGSFNQVIAQAASRPIMPRYYTTSLSDTVQARDLSNNSVEKIPLNNILGEMRNTPHKNLNSFDETPSYQDGNSDNYFNNLPLKTTISVHTDYGSGKEAREVISHFSLPFSNPMRDLLIKITQLETVPFGQFLRSIELLLSHYEKKPPYMSDYHYEYLQGYNASAKATLNTIKDSLEEVIAIDNETYSTLVNKIIRLLKQVIQVDTFRYKYMKKDQKESFPLIDDLTYGSEAESINKKAGDYLVPDAVTLLIKNKEFNPYSDDGSKNSPIFNEWINEALNGEIDENNISTFFWYLEKEINFYKINCWDLYRNTRDSPIDTNIIKEALNKTRNIAYDYIENPSQEGLSKLFFSLNDLIIQASTINKENKIIQKKQWQEEEKIRQQEEEKIRQQEKLNRSLLQRWWDRIVGKD
ncbi:MAG: hypothetical protein WBQ73_01705 [Candidatus Babeliales bacterium]